MNKKVRSPYNPTNFRLLDLSEPFYQEVESRQVSPSALLRDFVKDGLQPNRRLAAEELAALRNEVSMLRRELAPVGGNLNQLARSFNRDYSKFDYSKLETHHEQLQDTFKSLIDKLDSVRLRLR